MTKPVIPPLLQLVKLLSSFSMSTLPVSTSYFYVLLHRRSIRSWLTVGGARVLVGGLFVGVRGRVQLCQCPELGEAPIHQVG